MRHLRFAVLAAFAVVLYAAPLAGAHHPAVTPAQGKLLGEGWAQLYALPSRSIPTSARAIPA
jgi:hypothetical protein